ncbi:uncharacterized protein LOC141630949 [Silene latifolia]|uniref:uncharacterized protein LOC141630949 n=1 Tax=Silene latifolia TaxID=37657 RepID=UPI003D76E06E
MVFIPILSGNNDHYSCACINFVSEQIEYLDNRRYDDDFEKLPYFGISRIACDLMGAYLESKGFVRGSKVAGFKFVNVEFKWQGTGYSAFDCGVYMMIHMLLFNGKLFDCALGEMDVLNLVRAEVVSILILSDHNKVRESVRSRITQFRDKYGQGPNPFGKPGVQLKPPVLHVSIEKKASCLNVLKAEYVYTFAA